MAAVHTTAPRPGRTGPERLVVVLGIILTIGSLSAAVGAAYFGWTFAKVQKYDIALPEVATGQPANYLVVGSDSRDVVAANDPNAGAFRDGESGGRRSDTIMIVRVDPKRESATVLSLPRDLWVPIAGRDEQQRINAAYGMGKQVLADTIQQYLGIPVNHYVEVDFRGFQGLVNAIGGVPMYFERAMKDENSGLDVLHPGCVTLDGAAGLAFARSRHLEYMQNGVWRTDPTGDLGRITRQQLFIRKAIGRAVSKGITNPITMKRLVDVGVQNVGIDAALSPAGLLDLGRRFARFNSNDLLTYTLPVSPYTTDGGAQVLKLRERAAVATLDLFRARKGGVPGGAPALPTTVREPDVAVRVLNGSGVALRAANAAAAMVRAGFGIAGTGNASDVGAARVDRTEVRYAPDALAGAALVGRHLRAGAVLVADPALGSGQVTLVVGRDFTKVTARALPAIPGSGDDTGPTVTTSTTPTTRATTTTTAPVGRTPGEVPPGVSCG